MLSFDLRERDAHLMENDWANNIFGIDLCALQGGEREKEENIQGFYQISREEKNSDKLQ